MGLKLKGKLNLLVGSPQEFSLEHRFFNAIALISILQGVIAIVINVALEFFGLLALSVITATVGFVSFYYLSRVKRIFRVLIWPYILFTLSVLTLIWFQNGGSYGGVTFIYFIGVAILTVITAGRQRNLVILVWSLVVFAIYMLEFAFPSLKMVYSDDFERYLDVAITAAASIYFVSLTIKVVMQNYQMEKDKVEKEKDNTEEQLRLINSILASSPDAILIADLEEKIINCNPATLELFGYDGLTELMDKNAISQMVVERYHRKAEEVSREVLKEGLSKGVELFARKKNGDEFIIEQSKSTVYDIHNKPTLFVTVFKDITERKKYEKELREAKKDADNANFQKTRFLANMSHEIRTPMNGVIGMTNILLGTELDENQREYAQLVKISADSLLSIINDILDISKIEAGKLELAEQPFNLRSLLISLVKTFDVRCREKGIKLRYYISPEIPDAMIGDQTRLQQILVNLLGNSLKFTEQGELNLNVELLEVTKENKATLFFTVKDTGIGIAKEKLATIFDSFTQADVSTTKKYGGTGLGLTITKRLVRLMKGDITVDSVVGQGSTFSFTAKMGVADESKMLRRKPSLSIARKAEGLKGKTFLIAEDNYINQEFIQVLFKKYNLKYELVENGQEAVDAVAEKPYDCVVMDIHMPEMDGIEATRIIRAKEQEGGPSLPIVALTANAYTEDRERYLAVGMDDYVSKPVDVAHLFDVLQKAIKKYSKASL